jgi:hypothetical protein
MRVALIRDGLVENVIEAPDGWEAPSDLVMVPTDTAGPGWSYDAGVFVPPVESVTPEPVLPSMTYKADIWRRASDAEAETIVAVLGQQTVRKQRLFNDATVLSHADPEFAELRAGFIAAFGEARASELLAPS